MIDFCYSGSSSPLLRRFCDPAAYRMVLFDQRGCGKSTPFACLEDNTTWHSGTYCSMTSIHINTNTCDAVEDIEKLRVHLGIDKWIVLGKYWTRVMKQI